MHQIISLTCFHSWTDKHQLWRNLMFLLVRDWGLPKRQKGKPDVQVCITGIWTGKSPSIKLSFFTQICPLLQIFLWRTKTSQGFQVHRCRCGDRFGFGAASRLSEARGSPSIAASGNPAKKQTFTRWWLLFHFRFSHWWCCSGKTLTQGSQLLVQTDFWCKHQNIHWKYKGSFDAASKCWRSITNVFRGFPFRPCGLPSS